MKYLPSRGTVPQLKDYDMRHVLKAMTDCGWNTWKEATMSRLGYSLFIDVPIIRKGFRTTSKIDINTLQLVVKPSKFYSRAFGKNTPIKIARRMMEKLLSKGFIEVAERQDGIGILGLRKSKRWKLWGYQLTYKGYMYLQTPPKTRFDLFNPKSAKSFQAYLRKCKEEDDSRSVAVSKETAKTAEEIGIPISAAALEKLKTMKEGRETLFEAIIGNRMKVTQLTPLTPRPLAQIILSRLTRIDLIRIINEKELQEILAKNSRLPAVEPYIATQQINPFIVEDENGTRRYVAVMGDKAFVIADYPLNPEKATQADSYCRVCDREL